MSVTPDQVPGVQEVIKRLCELIEDVSAGVFQFSHPTDCFCGDGGFWPLRDASVWRHDPEASIAFVERATRRAIKDFRRDSDEHDANTPDPMTWVPS